MIHYRFKPSGGTTLSGRDLVDRYTYNDLSAGSVVEIEYLPGDTSRNRLAGGTDGYLAVLLPFMALLFGLLGMPMVRTAYLDAKKFVMLEQSARPHTAVVTGFKDTNISSGNIRQVRMTYLYTGPNGEQLTGATLAGKPDRFAAYSEGAEVMIAVDPKNPATSAWISDFRSG